MGLSEREFAKANRSSRTVEALVAEESKNCESEKEKVKVGEGQEITQHRQGSKGSFTACYNCSIAV